MCRIDSQLKNLIRLKYLIYETPYTFFSIFIWYFSFTHTSPMFSDIASNNFSFFGFSNRFFFVFVFTTFFKKILFLNIFSIYLILFQVKALLCHRKCKFMSHYLYFPNNLKDINRLINRPYIGL